MASLLDPCQRVPQHRRLGLEGCQKVLPDVHEIVFDASEAQHKRHRSRPTRQTRRFCIDEEELVEGWRFSTC